MQRNKRPAVVAVSGVKNSGKTTFLTHILALLKEKGISCAVIKHDGHCFEPDVPGTDSWRLRQAGADAAAVFCDSHFMICRNRPVTAEWLIGQFSDMDLILLEGMKNSPYQKIEIIRSEVSSSGVCSPDTLLAIASDIKSFPTAVPKIGLCDYEKAVEIILRYMEGSAQ